jgi:hypothetical protein
MAFTGSPVITLLSDRKLVIHGLSLAALAVGTLNLWDIAADVPAGHVNLPQGFNPQPYSLPSGDVFLPQSIEITVIPMSAVATAIPIEITKTGNDSPNFIASLTNNHGSINSAALEIWVEWH